MDQVTIPTAIPGSYQRLGYKTLALFIFQRSMSAFVSLLVSLGLFLLFNSNVPVSYSIPGSFTINIHKLSREGALLCFGLFFVFLALAFVVGWLIYINYQFQLDDDALKIKRGILTKEVIAIPYRQIQNVDVRRDVLYLVFGLSELVILTAGHEDKNDTQNEAEGILPAIDKNLAEKIQEDLLRRANVEKVTPADK